MHKASRRRLIGSLLTPALLVGVPAFAQPARPLIPPDIAGEWNLSNNEEDTTAQPPLGDYLGIPFNDAGRMRSDTSAESIWPGPTPAIAYARSAASLVALISVNDDFSCR